MFNVYSRVPNSLIPSDKLIYIHTPHFCKIFQFSPTPSQCFQNLNFRTLFNIAAGNCRFITNEQCLECNVDQASELFGSLIDLKRSLNKMDIEKPIVLPSSSACGSRGTSYSRVLGRMQTRNGAPEPPPNSRLEP